MRTRVRAASRVWLVLHAGALGGLGGLSGYVVLTIEDRPLEIVLLAVAAFGLTPGERDITQ